MIDQEEKNVVSFINISNDIVIVSEIYLRKNNQTINIALKFISNVSIPSSSLELEISN